MDEATLQGALNLLDIPVEEFEAAAK